MHFRCRSHSASTVSAHGEDEDLVHGAVEREPANHMTDRNWVRGDHTGPFCACRRRRNDALSQLTIMHGACLGVVLSVKCETSEDTEIDCDRISKIRARQSTRNEQSYKAICGSERRGWTVRAGNGRPKSAFFSRLPPVQYCRLLLASRVPF